MGFDGAVRFVGSVRGGPGEVWLPEFSTPLVARGAQ